MYTEKFAERLKELIGTESINSVAKRIGIPQPTLSRYILSKRNWVGKSLQDCRFFWGKFRFYSGEKRFLKKSATWQNCQVAFNLL